MIIVTPLKLSFHTGSLSSPHLESHHCKYSLPVHNPALAPDSPPYNQAVGNPFPQKLLSLQPIEGGDVLAPYPHRPCELPGGEYTRRRLGHFPKTFYQPIVVLESQQSAHLVSQGRLPLDLPDQQWTGAES